MAGFNFTELEAGERIVFGPVTSTKTASLSGSGAPGQGQGSLSRTSGRTVGVTTQRVIIEDLKAPDNPQIIPNADVQRVFIKRKTRQGSASIDLAKVETASGQTVKLDLKGVPAQAESAIQETFPNAEVVEGKGGGKKKLLIVAAIVIAGILILMCVLPFLIAALGRLFGG